MDLLLAAGGSRPNKERVGIIKVHLGGKRTGRASLAERFSPGLKKKRKRRFIPKTENNIERGDTMRKKQFAQNRREPSHPEKRFLVTQERIPEQRGAKDKKGISMGEVFERNGSHQEDHPAK